MDSENFLFADLTESDEEYECSSDEDVELRTMYSDKSLYVKLDLPQGYRDTVSYRDEYVRICKAMGVEYDQDKPTKATRFISDMLDQDKRNFVRPNVLLPPPLTDITEVPKIPAWIRANECIYILTYMMYALRHNGFRIEIYVIEPVKIKIPVNSRLTKLIDAFNRSFTHQDKTTNTLVFYIEDYTYHIMWRSVHENGVNERDEVMSPKDFETLYYSFVNKLLYTFDMKVINLRGW